MTRTTKPKLVTFDVYMALLDIQGSLVPVVAETLGMDTDTAHTFVLMWRAKQMERAAVSNSLGLGHTSFRDCTHMGLDYVLHRYDRQLDEVERQRLVLAWDLLTPWPEAVEVVHAVKARGYATAVLSNGDQDMLEAVSGAFGGAFGDGFDHVLSAETAGHYKPHPDVYNLPTRLLGITKDEVLHVAGSPGDALGAGAFGLKCYWSNRMSDRVLDPRFDADHQGPDLNGVLNIL
ncbi:MAG: haloacid dehalogenase type II [Rhodospirillaceae bacterium]|nr:haloacid dehalogenase type II [Rhodospirillaceae bacterium]